MLDKYQIWLKSDNNHGEYSEIYPLLWLVGVVKTILTDWVLNAPTRTNHQESVQGYIYIERER